MLKRIITQKVKKQNLEKKAKKLVICNAKKKFIHCVTKCFHGTPHIKETERDALCHSTKEVCDIQTGIIKVICKPLTKKQQKEWVEKELKNESQP